MSEWLKEFALKANVATVTRGSNPFGHKLKDESPIITSTLCKNPGLAKTTLNR